jgi:RNA polymerase sigma factor (sigma-70 family)
LFSTRCQLDAALPPDVCASGDCRDIVLGESDRPCLSLLPDVRNFCVKQGSLLATRRSLVERLADWGDQLRWQEFFDTYSRLIHSAARQSGLTDAEAQEVVQETVITVAKNIEKLKYDPAIGSFKGWLLQITRWRIADQFRKREPGNARRPREADDRLTATMERIPDSRIADLDALWETEWKENLFAAALVRVKKKVEPKQFQIFDCYVRKEWPAQKVAERLGVNIGQVYLARHRVGALLKKEIKALEKMSDQAVS